MLETFEIKEKLSDAAYVAHIIFKTMVSFLVHAISFTSFVFNLTYVQWPATQRDCVMCSEMVPLVDDGWAVCNQSVTHPDCSPSDGKIRINCNVSLVVRQRFIDEVKSTSFLIFSRFLSKP